MKVLKSILLFLWQLPQYMVGYVWLLIQITSEGILESATVRLKSGFETRVVFLCNKSNSAVSFGNLIFVNGFSADEERNFKALCETYIDTIRHESGHAIQSRLLGWFYLIIIGLPSFVSASVGSASQHRRFYTETWANRLIEKYGKA
jgi:hypothetical protein